MFADVNEFVDALSSVDLTLFPLALLLGLAPLAVFAFTWYRILNNMSSQLKYLKVLQLYAIGKFMNSVTPLGNLGGEPFMAYVIKRNTDLSYEESFAAVLSSDIINTLPIFTMVFGGATVLAFKGGLLEIFKEALFVAAFSAGSIGLLSYLLWFRPGTVEGVLRKASTGFTERLRFGGRYSRRLNQKLNDIEEAFEIVGDNPKHILMTGLVAHLVPAANILCAYVILYSLGLRLDPLPLILVLPMASLANFTPTPGGSGTYEGALAFILTIFYPVSLSTGLVAAVVFRLANYWPGIIIGYLTLLKLEAEK